MIREYTWLSVSPVDGHVIAEIPSVQCSTLEIRMMEGTTATATIPWQDIKNVSNWENATKPFAACLLLIDSSMPAQPLWGGIILSRTRELGNATLSIKLGTWEHLLNKYPVGDDNYTNTDQNKIITGLVTKWAITGKRNSLTIDAQTSKIKRDDTDHKASDNKSVLSCIQALAGVINGPEWYINWQKSSQNYRPVLHVADHIGSVNSMFTFGAESLTEFTINEAWEEGYGANTVQAYSSATNTDDGAEQPQSDWYTYDDQTRPLLPYRYQPSTSITNKSTLNQHAQAKLQALQDGTNTITVSFSLTLMPRLGIDWNLGDTISWNLETAKNQLTDYTTGATRFIGYTIDLQNNTFKPYLQNEGEI